MTDYDYGPPVDDLAERRAAAATETVSVAQYRDILKRQANTRGNEPTESDGYTFDSRAEAARYAQLKLAERAGAISDLRVHPVYELQAAFRDAAGRRHRSIRYEADFSYQEGGREVVEDTKGHATAVFKLKEKMFRFRYPSIDFRVVKV
jgi:hypothetical protein